MVNDNGVIFKSMGDYKIYKFLKENNIEYEYEKKYHIPSSGEIQM